MASRVTHLQVARGEVPACHSVGVRRWKAGTPMTTDWQAVTCRRCIDTCAYVGARAHSQLLAAGAREEI